MKRYSISDFGYTSVKGEHSDRLAFIISTPSDSYMALDLTEFDEKELEYYIPRIEAMFSKFDQEIKEAVAELGLSGNYRRFKAEGVEE